MIFTVTHNLLKAPKGILTCGTEGRRNGSLSGFIIKRPSNSAAAQCHALIDDPSIPITA